MRKLVLFALLLPAIAFAKKAPMFEDHGAVPPNDPYHHDTQATTGRMEGFRRLYVDADKFPDTLVPALPAGGLVADLVIPNPTSSWVKLTISGTEIGQVRSFDTAILHGMKPGTYAVTFTSGNLHTWTENLSTD